MWTLPSSVTRVFVERTSGCPCAPAKETNANNIKKQMNPLFFIAYKLTIIVPTKLLDGFPVYCCGKLLSLWYRNS
jgi:hypothetical protein